MLSYTDQNGLFQCFLEWHSLIDMCARPLYKHLFKIWSRLTEKYKNCLKQGKTKNWLTPFHDQTERGQVCWSQYLLWVLKEIPQERPSLFIPLKLTANHRYCRDCALLHYTKKRKHSYRRKRVINHKAKKYYFSASTEQLRW